MRQPTSRDKALEWHRAALDALRLHLDVGATHADHPEAGWFERRLTKGGMFVPARIWIAQAIDPDTGELVDDEEFLCEVAGEPADAWEQWPWLCGRPITEARYRYMMDLREWAQEQNDYEPAADARQAVDFRKLKPGF